MQLKQIGCGVQAQQKLNMDNKVHTPTGFGDIIEAIFSESGISGFWKGLLPSLVLVVNPAIQYMLYEQLQRLLRQWKARRISQAASSASAQGGQEGSDSASSPPPSSIKLSAGEIFLVSALAKVGATVATYWLVVVKSRLQAAGKGTPKELQYTSTWDAISRIYLDEGVGGFFKGLKAKILQTALNAALMLMLKEQVYSSTKQLLNSEGMHRFVMSLIKG